MAIDKKDIKKLSEVFATKEDLKAFATKEDLKAFATKKDLGNLKGEILVGQDKIMKKIEDITIEQKMAYSQYKRHENKLEDHEKRITSLEAKV